MLLLVALLTGCSAVQAACAGSDARRVGPDVEVAPEADGVAGRPRRPGVRRALSEPVEDSYYPDIGDPGVDALHYGLSLAWNPRKRVLTGVATVVFRATGDDSQFQLDLSPALDVGEVTLDGEPVETTHDGKDLVVDAPVVQDQRYVLEVRLLGHAGAGRRADHARRLQHHRLHDHADRRDLDDAGAVRRAHLVPGQRPARRTRRSTTSR